MAETILAQGNETVGWGALTAGCRHYFAYPITPQNEICAFFSRELPGRGGTFIQPQSELGVINMVYGAAACGARVMTSTSGPGWHLMQEGVTLLSAAHVPCVIALVSRGGLLGGGGVRHGQDDYTSVTRGCSGRKNIVLAPFTIQEVFDLTQLAFFLADTYRTPVIVQMDAVIGQTAEPLEMKKLDMGPGPDNTAWALCNWEDRREKVPRVIGKTVTFLSPGPMVQQRWAREYQEKVDRMEQHEVRYDQYYLDDSELVVVAWGYAARSAVVAVEKARKEGLKAGMVRPVTLWPFPYDVLAKAADRGCRFLVVEDCLGQMIDDVGLGAGNQAEIGLVGYLDRHQPDDGGVILPETILDKIKTMMDGDDHAGRSSTR